MRFIRCNRQIVAVFCLALSGLPLALKAETVPGTPLGSVTCTDGQMLDRLSAEAGQPYPAKQQEIWRIVDWLKACSKKPAVGERLLYTWGHKNKLQRMLRSDRLSFYAYDRSRQLTYNQLQAYKILSTLHYGPAQAIADARALLRDPGKHNLIELAAVAEFTSREKAKEHDALLLAMYEQWLPGFLDLAERPVGDRLKWVLSELNGANENSLRHHAAQGIQDALIQFEAREKGPGSSNFLSSSSLGWGVSFSTSAVQFLNHFYDENHMGLVCRTPANQRRIMLNIDSVHMQAAFSRAQIFLLNVTRGLPLANSTLYARPAAFEEASKGHILVSRAGHNVGLVYTEKAALDHSQVCEAVTVENFPCQDWPDLLRRPEYITGAQGPGVVQRYLERNRPPASSNLPFAQRVQQKTESCRSHAESAGS